MDGEGASPRGLESPSMDIGIGLPTAVPNTPGSLWVPFAREAEAAGFKSLSTIGRTVFDSHEELVVLAACAAVTTTVKLVPTVMIGPPRQNVMLAKQAATLHNLSGGRLVLGLGIGWRRDDFEIVGRGDDWKRRGKLLEQQIDELRRIWAEGKVGPHPGSPVPIMIGGNAPEALRRAGRYADAFIAGPFPVDQVREHFAAVDAAAGERKPEKWTSKFFALGDDVEEQLAANVRAYYSAGGEEFVKQSYEGVLRTPDQIRRYVDDMRSTGASHLCLWPQVNGIEQVERLAEVIFSGR
jgi:alkanesulfonate monooxygenase SsuD/methylene tetrahydromethanopterin reductase-like flavin-dependent oxidoreductase (luciferase family)